MKLRNKRTGEIGNLHYDPEKEYHFIVSTDDPADMRLYKKLSQLNEKWEDVPEELGKILNIYTDETDMGRITIEYNTEKAEKAVEKLKAWKRLEDKGFRFCGGDDACISYAADIENWSMQDLQDFDLLFGGEK